MDIQLPKMIYHQDIGEAEADFEKLVLDGFEEMGEYHLVEYIHPETGESRVVVACPIEAIARMFYLMLVVQRQILIGGERHPEMRDDIVEITEFFERDSAIEEFQDSVLNPNMEQRH